MKHLRTDWTVRCTIALAASSVAALLSACGPSVKPISLHDPVVPIDSRRFIADTQDAVSIAKANRDVAVERLGEMREWRKEMLGIEWPSKASKAVQQLESLADARIELAELELDSADIRLQLAEAKYQLVTAEMAVRHDLATYELEPLRAEADEARGKVKAVSESIIKKRDEIDKLTSEWWEAYRSFASSGGDTRRYYVPFIDVESAKKAAKKKKKPKKEDDAKKKSVDEKDSKKSKDSKDEKKEPTTEDQPLRIW